MWPRIKKIAKKAIDENGGLKGELQAVKEACQVEKAKRESERTSMQCLLAKTKEKLRTMEAERDLAIEQMEKGKEALAEEMKAAHADEVKRAYKEAIIEFINSDRYVNFMDRMQKRGYMLAIKHVKQHFPDVSFEPYKLHPNMGVVVVLK